MLLALLLLFVNLIVVCYCLFVEDCCLLLFVVQRCSFLAHSCSFFVCYMFLIIVVQFLFAQTRTDKQIAMPWLNAGST